MSFTTYIVTTIKELRDVIEDLPDDMKVEIAEGGEHYGHNGPRASRARELSEQIREAAHHQTERAVPRKRGENRIC
jgi:hypothetical protein